VIPPLAQDPPADDSPSQAWIRDWVDFLTEMLPLILPVVVILVAILLIFKAKSGIVQVIGFGVGAAVVFLLLTNLESVADFFRNELPFEAPSGQGEESGGEDSGGEESGGEESDGTESGDQEGGEGG
jgi:hypothetical protein